MNKEIYEIIKTLSGVDVFSETDELKSLGIDSLRTVELILLLEERLLIEVPNEELKSENFKSLLTLTDMVKRLKE